MRIAAVWLLFVAVLPAEQGFSPLFNGKNLDGWEIDTPGVWHAEKGMIVGKSPGLKYNDFLRTKKNYSDFVLKLSFRLLDTKGNSGVQFRSKPVPDSHEVAGYQADIADSFWGSLYDESRRKKYLVQASAESLAAVKKDGWNDLVITAHGGHVTIDLNGLRAVDYRETDHAIERKGFIALQVHSGPPFEVNFKDLQIRELEK